MTDYNEVLYVVEAQVGSGAAFEDLVRRYEKNLFRPCLRITRYPEDAEEVLQETFLKAYEHLREFRGESSFWTWLARIAINEVMMKLLRRVAETRVCIEATYDDTGENPPADFVDRRPDSEQVALKAEVQALIRRAIWKLPHSLQAAAFLRCIEDFSMQETMEALHESMPAIKTKLFRARHHLRKELQKAFGNGNTRGIRPRLNSSLKDSAKMAIPPWNGGALFHTRTRNAGFRAQL